MKQSKRPPRKSTNGKSPLLSGRPNRSRTNTMLVRRTRKNN